MSPCVARSLCASRVGEGFRRFRVCLNRQVPVFEDELHFGGAGVLDRDGVATFVQHGGLHHDDALLQALRQQDAAVAQTTPAATGPTAGSTAKSKGAKVGKKEKNDGEVIAQTANGTVHQITGFEPTKQKTEEDTKIVESNVKQSGATYIEAQQNLPDVIVVGGDPDSAPALPAGAQP